jgi:hypothetical protein
MLAIVKRAKDAGLAGLGRGEIWYELDATYHQPNDPRIPDRLRLDAYGPIAEHRLRDGDVVNIVIEGVAAVVLVAVAAGAAGWALAEASRAPFGYWERDL